MTPPDRTAREREAREAVRRNMICKNCHTMLVNEQCKSCNTALGAYAAAIEARVRAEVRASVQAMRDEVPTCCAGSERPCGYDTLFDEQRETYDKVLAALPTTPGGEGT